MNCAACRRSFKALGFFNTIETTKFRPTLEIIQKEKAAWTLDRRIRLKFRANQSSSKPKRIRSHFKAWNFSCTIQTNLLGEEGVSTDEKILLLTEHLRIGLGHKCPRMSPPLLFSAIFHWSRSQRPITRYRPFDFGQTTPIFGFVQAQNRTVHTMIGS